jgi:hypothetical protein
MFIHVSYVYIHLCIKQRVARFAPQTSSPQLTVATNVECCEYLELNNLPMNEIINFVKFCIIN